MFAGWGVDLFNLLAVPHAFLLLKFLWLPRHRSQIYNLVKTSPWFKPQGRRSPLHSHTVREEPCALKSRVHPQTKLLFTLSQWCGTFFFFFFLCAAVLTVPEFNTHFLCGNCLNFTLTHPSNPNYLWIVSREYYSKWSSSLSSPLVSGYAFEGPRMPKPPQSCWTAKKKRVALLSLSLSSFPLSKSLERGQCRATAASTDKAYKLGVVLHYLC